MASENMEALVAALREDEVLRQRLSEASAAEDIERIAAEAGFPVTAAEFLSQDTVDVSDAELESLAGGYTFPPTDWIYCDNPWTNAWCTLRC